MEIYWRLKDIPELRSLSKAQRSEIWAGTIGARFRDPVIYLLMVAFFLIVALGNYLGDLIIPLRLGGAIGGGLGAGVAAWLGVIVTYQRCRPYLAAEVLRRLGS